jgi:hypothetical protein
MMDCSNLNKTYPIYRLIRTYRNIVFLGFEFYCSTIFVDKDYENIILLGFELCFELSFGMKYIYFLWKGS